MMKDTLSRIHADIEARVASIRTDRADWPCCMGCDTCCRRLAGIPRLTEAEWVQLREGLASLPPERFQIIREAVATLARQASRPVVCPMLDQSAGACMVYDSRPVACRTYGFYRQRDLGLYCKSIEADADEGNFDDVVWGNHDAIDHRLAGLGETRELTAWFGEFPALGP